VSASTARRAGGEPLVARLARRGRFLVAEPFFDRGPRFVVDRGSRGATEGAIVLVRPGSRGSRGRGHATIERVIGSPEVARDVIEALMLARGLRRRFDPAVERAARETRPPEVPRRDLRDLPTFTIDPATAKDFDDAISAEALGDGRWRIWVHIADVSAYVRPGSLVDREAYRRATSVYVPGAVEPMLPEALSNEACSLVPYQDRLAVTVELELQGARTTRARFDRSLIRSDARLSYEDVDEVFAGEREPDAVWAAPLAAAREAAAALADARAARGALNVESLEPEFEFEAGHVASSAVRQATESHRLIEHLMIAANEAVARHLSDTRTPTLYRVHERPEPAAVQRLAGQLASLDVATPPLSEHMTPQEAADAVAEMSRLVDEHVRRTGRGRAGLTALVLRSLKQAHYDPSNLGHAGLHSTHYCHFTSPIRRYPDLICHRALLSTLSAGEDAPEPSRLGEAASWTSTREREAMDVERSADNIARAFLLERDMFEHGWERDFPGEVVGVIGAGAFVSFGGGYEGLLPVRRLHGDWFGLNEEGTILTGSRTGKAIRIGDPARVQVERVDTARGRVDLLPVEL
jgi:ribonuclease R